MDEQWRFLTSRAVRERQFLLLWRVETRLSRQVCFASVIVVVCCHLSVHKGLNIDYSVAAKEKKCFLMKYAALPFLNVTVDDNEIIEVTDAAGIIDLYEEVRLAMVVLSEVMIPVFIRTPQAFASLKRSLRRFPNNNKRSTWTCSYTALHAKLCIKASRKV